MRVDSSLVQVVSAPIERVGMTPIESSFAVRRGQQRSEEKQLCSQFTKVGPHCYFLPPPSFSIFQKLSKFHRLESWAGLVRTARVDVFSELGA